MTDSSPTAPERETGVGSYFVANYPPFSVWSPAAVATDARAALSSPGTQIPLGLYLHIPFCRKRCHFCYFRVYTNKNAQEVTSYLEVLAREWDLFRRQPAIADRTLNFVYFGGGTPSFLSTTQLTGLVERLTASTGGIDSWRAGASAPAEVTFECEPGTLTDAKLSVLRDLGVTRLSLGVENFDDHILDINGRAHRSPEIGRSYDSARKMGFPQINIDLIAGMLGETDENWHRCIEQTLALGPDSVTIYQMELPFNTAISSDLLKGTGLFKDTVASWATKRRWVGEAFAALERAGYHIGSAYTAVKRPEQTKFVYRDRLWEGADLIGLGVASFGHVNGVHMQNLDTWETYCEAVDRAELPLGRAYRPSAEERLIREVVLQLKRGWITPAYFLDKYGVDIKDRFSGQFESLLRDGYLAASTPDKLYLTREALLRVDTLLPRFFLPQHTNIRYT